MSKTEDFGLSTTYLLHYKLFSYLHSLDTNLIGFIIPQRVVLSIMGFFAIVNAYAMRVCLNVAITEIVVKNGNNSDLENHQYCPADDDDVGGGSGGGEFDWSQQLQGVILGSFFWGYVNEY